MGKLQAFIWMIILVAAILIIIPLYPYLALPPYSERVLPNSTIVREPLPAELAYLTTLMMLAPPFFVLFAIYRLYLEWRSE